MDNTKKNPNVPNLRFFQFEENWKTHNITNLGKINRGKSKHRPRDDERLYNGKYPFIQTGDIKKSNFVLYKCR